MAQVESSDLALQHPSPVLLEAVLKVEQVVARLQNLQSTISGIHLSPVNAKLHTRPYEAKDATGRAKDFVAGKESTRLTQRRDEDRRKSSKYHNADSKLVQRETPKKSKGEWKKWSSPANQVHDVISEILMASEYAKQIATLVAEALLDGPVKTAQAPVPEPKKTLSKDGKRKDIAFPSKAQVQRTMNGKVQSSKPVNKFKVFFPNSDSQTGHQTAKLGATAKLSRTLSPRLGVRSPEKRRASHKLFTSPTGSFRESDFADDELSDPRRLSMNVTEIRGSSKPWKLTPTRGVLFSNPVYMETSAVRPSPVKIVPGKKESMRRRSGDPMSSSLSKVTFKREGAAPKPDLATKRDHKTRKAKYIEMVPLDAPQNSSITTMLDVLKVKSPRSGRRRLQPLDANNVDVTEERSAMSTKEEVQCRVSHSHVNSTPIVENGHEKSIARVKQGSSADSESDKENTPIPRCAPAAVKDLFLRSMSSGHALNRTVSRKNPGVSLLQRAKGWMSSQAMKQGRVRELERCYGYLDRTHLQSTRLVRQQSVHKFKVIFPSNDRLAFSEEVCGQANNVLVFKVHYPKKPVIGSSLFPGSIEMFLPGVPHSTDAASMLPRRSTETPSWLRRVMNWTGLFRKQSIQMKPF